MEDISKTPNKETGNVKQNQSERKDSITEIKKYTRGNRLEEAEGISNLEDTGMESKQAEQERKKQ